MTARCKIFIIGLFGLKVLVADGLVAGHDDGVDYVVDCSAAGEVVDGSSETLEDGSYGTGAGKALHEFVGDVTGFERGEDEGVGVAGNGAVRSFLRSYRGYSWAEVMAGMSPRPVSKEMRASL